MHWPTKKDTPRTGDQRTVKKFAWKPTALDTGWTVWLEFYLVVYKFYENNSGGYWWQYKTGRLA